MFRKSYISLDVGNKNIKMIWGRIRKDKILIFEYGIKKTPVNAIKDGKIINPDAIADVVREFIKENGVKADKCIINITGTGVITREIQLPKSTCEEIEKMLEYEAQQYFPVDLGDYVLDYKVLEEVINPEGIFDRIMLAAVPVKQADEYMKVAQVLKMDMEAIDLPANSISKFLSYSGSQNEDCSEGTGLKEFAVLDIGSDTTGVYIFCDGKLRFNRTILNGSSEFDRMISKELNVDLSQAEERKIFKTKILREDNEIGEEPESIKLCNIIRPVVNSIILDVNKFFDFYNSRKMKNKVQKIFICGGGSKLLGLSAYIGGYFNIPVQYLNVSDNIVYSGKRKKEQFHEDLIYLVNAAGAVVRGRSL